MLKKRSIICCFIVVFLALPFYSLAQTADDLKAKIEDRNRQIKQLEDEINQYNIEVSRTGAEAQTLQNTIKSLNLTEKKITTDLTLTENKISKTNLTIEQLSDEIDGIVKSVSQNKKAIADLMRDIEDRDNTDILTVLLSEKSLREVWSEVDSAKQAQNQIKNKSGQLRMLQENLETKQTQLLGQKSQLSVLREDLSGKKQAVVETKQEKATLLTQTKNQEQAFKKLISDREAQKAKFEKELYAFEAQLKLTIDPESYPAPKNGILSWPLDNVLVTQLFGKTVGAEKLYTSGSHNGIDFRASIGTKVKNVLDGIVAGTGNTDQYPGCYSFGKWVMVRHDNGLSTIYGHLSVISVSTGQKLSTGDVIGYSGNTGYSTGPHLHISVYATQGVRIEKYTNSRGCKEATIPLADIRAYLDPMAYLPK